MTSGELFQQKTQLSASVSRDRKGGERKKGERQREGLDRFVWDVCVGEWKGWRRKGRSRNNNNNNKLMWEWYRKLGERSPLLPPCPLHPTPLDREMLETTQHNHESDITWLGRTDWTYNSLCPPACVKSDAEVLLEGWV